MKPLPESEASGPNDGPDVFKADVEAYAGVLLLFREFCADRDRSFHLEISLMVQKAMRKGCQDKATLAELNAAIDAVRRTARPTNRHLDREGKRFDRNARNREHRARYRAKQRELRAALADHTQGGQS